MNAPNRTPPGQRHQNPQMVALQGMRDDLGQMKQHFIQALPATIPSDKFIRTAMTLVQLRPDLLADNVDRKSLLMALVRCASDGLLPDGREATVTIFNQSEDDEESGQRQQKGKKQAVYIPMYQGLLKQIRNSGELKSIAAHIVYANDQFDHVLGDEEKIIHKAAKGDRGLPTHVYAVLHTKDGGIYRRVLDKDRIEEIRMRSQMGKKNKGPWKTDWKEMWLKTAIRSLSKHAPKSTELDRYLDVVREQDDRAGQRIQRLDAAPLPDGDAGESLQAQLFHLKTQALAALSDSTTEADANKIWTEYRNACTKIDQPPDLEVESRWGDHIEAIKQKQLELK